mmetsp:Transcript_39137/g.80161  ORF Transcript_39137/g.80161 Transcript_39137/m.80161 type:complete len:241 (-) Transcript_39137:431-1153(-)|eukprot:CAMPEP_0178483764 /NCGR_PEP_ID=MMETSP0696-20121128/7403_1 /TAXON_ID=265572 /ORGANISM="Extubocellulus spinifer, Strain CCMP396" /LENGTH=240 /DNA_ID=CAMNT_0020111293 /DNA_START=332 /DNA_END=1054 /DNA_ORIENTATION=-
MPRRRRLPILALAPREAVAWATLSVVHLLSLACIFHRTGKGKEISIGNAPQGNSFTWFGGHPPASREGSTCWCNPHLLKQRDDARCSCTASLAVDAILTSGPDHVWLVERKDTGQLACMGGFVDVNETGEEAVLRELKEETGIELPKGEESGRPIFLGLYSDPRRDNRRPTASMIYSIDIPLEYEPKGNDDVKGVVRVELSSIDSSGLDFFADHLTILLDYRDSRRRSMDLDASQAEICR